MKSPESANGAAGIIGKYRYVWSAAGLQAKSELTFVVCANVFGLSWSQQLLAMMESARFLPYKPYGLEDLYRYQV